MDKKIEKKMEKRIGELEETIILLRRVADNQHKTILAFLEYSNNCPFNCKQIIEFSEQHQEYMDAIKKVRRYYE